MVKGLPPEVALIRNEPLSILNANASWAHRPSAKTMASIAIDVSRTFILGIVLDQVTKLSGDAAHSLNIQYELNTGGVLHALNSRITGQ